MPNLDFSSREYWWSHVFTGRRVIQDLVVRCENVDMSCEWQGTVNALKAHLDICKYALVHCPQKCGELILRKDVAEHRSSKCSFRMYKCPFCGESGIYAYITKVHDAKCSKKIVSCSNSGCNQVMQRCLVEEHVKFACDYTIVLCKYKNFGCDMKAERRHMQQHEDDHKLHLDMAVVTTSELEHRVAKLETSLQEATKNIAIVMEQLDKQQQKATQDLSIQAKRVDKLECIVKPMEYSISSLEKQHVVSQSSVRDIVRTTVESSLTLLENKLNIFGFQELCEFTLFQYEKKRRTNKSYTSQPFYTHDDGYNLAIKIEANGVGDSEGTHVSAYVLVKQGRNDGNIPWPFVGRVTIVLLNQLEDKNHYAVAVLMESANDLQVGSEWGYEKFISHIQLDYNPVKNTRYLMNDTLCFRVCIW